MDESNYTILLVEDDENDAMLVRLAFQKNKILHPVQWAKDGLEAIAYLNGDGICGQVAVPFSRSPHSRFENASHERS